MINCNRCRRHIRADESACPFCGSTLETTGVGGSGLSSRSGSRPELLVGVALAGCLSLMGCEDETGDEETTSDATTGDDTGTEESTDTGTESTTDTESSGGSDYGGAPVPDPDVEI